MRAVIWPLALVAGFGCCSRSLAVGPRALPEVVRRIDAAGVQQLKRAWMASHAGASNAEEVVVVSRKQDGLLEAVLQPHGNVHGRGRFLLCPGAAAIFHTHPNSLSPEPSAVDRRLADRLGIPVATMTSQGLFVYDPKSTKTWRVLNRLDWLSFEAWVKVRAGE